MKDSGVRANRYNPEQAAQRIQSQFRGFRTRRSLGDTMSGGFDASQTLNDPFDENSMFIGQSIIEAEEALLKCLRSRDGIGLPPDMRQSFMALDRMDAGRVNRKQFAHALRQHHLFLPLAPEHLRTFMDYFEVPSEASSVDYRAFLIFSGNDYYSKTFSLD